METYIVKVPVSGNVELVPFDKDNSYKQLSDAVGGYIECAIIPNVETAGDYSLDCYVNEEGLLEHLPLNYRITVFAAKSYGGPLVGDAVFVGHDDMGETVGLTKADADSIVKTINSIRF